MSISYYQALPQHKSVRFTIDTFLTESLNPIPASFTFNSGITFPRAFAAQVDDGIMIHPAALTCL